MLTYVVRRVLIMFMTLLAVSALVFVIIQLPPGDYLTTYIAELESQGELVDPQKIEFLRQEYGLDKPMIEQYWVWVSGMVQGDLGYSFEYELPVNEVVGDRLLLSFVLNFSTIIFIWMISFPIGIYSATHQYSWGDHSLTFLGFLGLSTPNFLLALILLYFANVTFGTSIGGLMAEEYLNKPWSWAKFMSVLEHMWVPVVVIGQVVAVVVHACVADLRGHRADVPVSVIAVAVLVRMACGNHAGLYGGRSEAIGVSVAIQIESGPGVRIHS